MMTRNIKYLFLILIFLACEKQESEGIPAYLEIEQINLNNQNETHNISDAWVYINDQLQGVYELPAKFPVLESGTQTVRVRAGIKDNGIASSRIPYPFYGSYIEEVNFIENEKITVTPTVEYQNLNPNYLNEDFEDNSTQVDTTLQSEVDFTKITEFGNSYLYASLTDSFFTFQVSTDAIEDLPQAGAPVYLELDYKCNTTFLVGVYVNYPLVVRKDLLFINPKEDWNKIYINLTGTISESINAPSFSIFVEMMRDFDQTENEIYLDNFKIVY